MSGYDFFCYHGSCYAIHIPKVNEISHKIFLFLMFSILYGIWHKKRIVFAKFYVIQCLWVKLVPSGVIFQSDHVVSPFYLDWKIIASNYFKKTRVTFLTIFQLLLKKKVKICWSCFGAKLLVKMKEGRHFKWNLECWTNKNLNFNNNFHPL